MGQNSGPEIDHIAKSAGVIEKRLAALVWRGPFSAPMGGRGRDLIGDPGEAE